jgi:hypothetical protein
MKGDIVMSDTEICVPSNKATMTEKPIKKERMNLTSVGVSVEVKAMLDKVRDHMEKETGKRLSYNETLEELCRISLIPSA